MILTDQTIFHDPDNGVHGNCLSAVLASLLEMPIEDVPIFSSDSWIHELNDWLRPFGLAFLSIERFGEFAHSWNIKGCHHELAGDSPRAVESWKSVGHATVAIDGKLEFDPHPSRSGIVDKNVTHGLFISLRPWETKAGAIMAQENQRVANQVAERSATNQAMTESVGMVGPCACIGPEGDCPCLRKMRGQKVDITETYVAADIFDLLPDEDKNTINSLKHKAVSLYFSRKKQ